MKLIYLLEEDYSPYVIAGSYEVNSEDVYNEWEDGWWVRHRTVVRTRIHGKLRLKFNSYEKYQKFLEDLQKTKQDNGSYLLTVYVNNTGKAKAIEAYIENDMALYRYHGETWKSFSEFDLEIEER